MIFERGTRRALSRETEFVASARVAPRSDELSLRNALSREPYRVTTKHRALLRGEGEVSIEGSAVTKLHSRGAPNLGRGSVVKEISSRASRYTAYDLFHHSVPPFFFLASATISEEYQ